MSHTPAVQAARKAKQLERLEMKGKEGYPEYYASQPFQVERARLNKEHRDAKKALAVANEALEIALITGDGLKAAKEAAAIAALVVERSTPPRRGTRASAGLTGA